MTDKSKRSLLAMMASNQTGDLLSAGYSLSDLRSAGYSLSDLLSAGYSLSDLLSAGYSLSDLDALEAEIPLIEKPYTHLLADIKAEKRRHQQSTWGPESAPKNVCNTPMCTAGHLVNMGGPEGYSLKQKYGWAGAASMIHYKAHPDWPCQNFGAIPDEWAMAYIEEMAEREAVGPEPEVAA